MREKNPRVLDYKYVLVLPDQTVPSLAYKPNPDSCNALQAVGKRCCTVRPVDPGSSVGTS